MKVTAIEFAPNGRRLREVEIFRYDCQYDWATVIALRGKYKDVPRHISLANLKWWHVYP